MDKIKVALFALIALTIAIILITEKTALVMALLLEIIAFLAIEVTEWP